MQVERSFAQRARSFIAAALLAVVGGNASVADSYFDVTDMQVMNDKDVPEVCFTFSGDLPTAREATLEDYVSVSPPFAES